MHFFLVTTGPSPVISIACTGQLRTQRPHASPLHPHSFDISGHTQIHGLERAHDGIGDEVHEARVQGARSP